MTPFRVENVGIFVRPRALLEARARHADGRIGGDEPRRVEDEEIARFAPLDRLDASTQCGFAGEVAGDGLDAADRTAKIDLLFRFAEDVWGGAATEPVRP